MRYARVPPWESEVGPHCTDMTTDSQRNARAAGADRPDTWLGPVLVAGGVVSPAQLEALADPPAVWSSVVAAGWATDAQIVEAVARRFRLPVANLASAEPRTVALLPESLARRHRVVPLSANDRNIQIATADPRDLDVEQTLGFVSGRDVCFQIAAPAALIERIDELYRPERSIERLLGGLEPARVEALDLEAIPDTREHQLEAPVAKLVDAMISD